MKRGLEEIAAVEVGAAKIEIAKIEVDDLFLRKVCMAGSGLQDRANLRHCERTAQVRLGVSRSGRPEGSCRDARPENPDEMRSNHRRTSAPRRDLGRRRPGLPADRKQKLPSQTHSTASSPAGKDAKREARLSDRNGWTRHGVRSN